MDLAQFIVSPLVMPIVLCDRCGCGSVWVSGCVGPRWAHWVHQRVAGALDEAVCAGTAGSGVLVSFLRIFTKAVYPQDVHGLRNSALLYFSVGILLMIICLVFYNVAHRLPVIKYYNELKMQAVNEEKEEKGSLSGPVWEIMGKVKWHGIGIVLIYVVTLSIFPGFITEDVHSAVLGDWFNCVLVLGRLI